MFCLDRMIWFFAVVGWAANGYYLHRELPRQLGPEQCRIALEKNVPVFGFLKDTHQVIARDCNPTEKPPYQRLIAYDAETGKKLREMKGPPWRLLGVWAKISESRGLVLVDGGPGADGDPVYGSLHVLHLDSGKWQKISPHHAEYHVAHPTRPWVLFQVGEKGRAGSQPPRVIVYDFEQEREVFSGDLPRRGYEFAAPAFFLGTTNRIVVPLRDARQSSNTFNKPAELELWEIAEPAKKIAVGQTPRFGYLVETTDSGLVKFVPSFSGHPFIDVFDFNSNRLVFSHPPEKMRTMQPVNGPGQSSHFSASGRNIVGGIPPRLWELRSGKVLWKARDGETVRLEPRGNRFRVSESTKIGGWTIPANWTTVAIRDLETGSLVKRIWSRHADATWVQSADGLLSVEPYRGIVRRNDQDVDWTLIATCQTILALPLFLPWTVHAVMKG